MPTVASAAVKRTALTITFSETLGAAGSLANTAFAVKKTPAGGTQTNVSLSTTVGPAISGATVTLTLGAAVAVTDTVTVSYTKPTSGTSNKLVDAVGNEAAGFSGQAVANAVAPELQSATVNGPALTLSYDRALDEDSVPDKSAFTVKKTPQGGSEAAVSLSTTVGPAISGTTVTLTLAAAVAATDTAVKVSYTKPTSGTNNKLRDAAGNEAESFTDELVKNATLPATAAVDATDGHAVTLTFRKNLAAPGAGARRAMRQSFVVQGGYYQGTEVRDQSPMAIAVSGRTVTLNLGSPIPAGGQATVGYSRPASSDASGALRYANNALVESFTAAATRPGAAAPLPVAAQAEGTKLTLTFDQALDEGSAPAGSRFEIRRAAGTIAGTGAATQVSGRRVSVTLTSKAPEGRRNLHVWYAPGGDANPLRAASSGPRVGDITGFVGDGLEATAPTLSSAVAAGSKITLTFSEPLDESSTPAGGAFTVKDDGTAVTLAATDAVSVRGHAVVLTLPGSIAAGRTVKLSYTQPTSGSNNELRDVAGTKVATLAERTITNSGSADPGAPGLAATDPVTGDDWVLTLAFDQPLDPANVPAATAFTFSDPWKSIRSVAVRGQMVELRVSSPLGPCTTGFTLSYARPDTNALRNLWGTEAAEISDRAWTYGGTATCVDGVYKAATGSIILYGRRPFAQDAPPQPEWFAVAASGGPVTVTAAAIDPDDGHLLVLTVSREFAADETITVSYTRARGALGMWDIDGNQLADFANLTVENRVGRGPAVTGVEVASDAGADDTYGLGDRIRVAVTFAEAVTVDTAGGTPTLTIDMDPADWGEKQAAYASGSGTAELVFVHEVAEPNVSTEGVAVLADTLSANGGTIRSAAGVDAVLGHVGLGHDAKHKVDWEAEPEAPSAPAFDDGDEAALSIEENHADGAAVGTVAATDADGDALTYSLSGDDAEHFAIGADGAITVASGTTLDHEAKASYAFTAEVSDGEDADGAAEETATADDTIAVTVAVTNVEEPPGAPTDLALEAASAAELSASWTAPADTGALDVAGYELRWHAGEADPEDEAGWTETGDVGNGTSATIVGLAADTAYRVQVRAHGDGAGPWSESASGRTAAPAVTAVAISSSPADGDTYGLGETIRVALTFDEAVTVDTQGGTPRLKLDLDDGEDTGERWAAYEAGSGTETIIFAWQAPAPDESAAGVAVLADTLELNGGTIRSVATQADAALGHAGLAHDPAHRVDAAPPELVGGEIDGATMTLTFSEALDPASTGGRFHMGVEVPELGEVGFVAAGDVAVEGATVTVGMGEVYPRATPGLDRNSVRYARRADGSGGPLQDLAGNPVLAPHRLVVAGANGDEDWRYVRIALVNVTNGAPRVTGVAVVSDAGGDATYALGERIRVALTFDEAVAVDTAGGTPQLTIDLDPAQWGEQPARYRGGSGTDTLVFVHEVVEPNVSTEGVAVLADTLILDGGTIRSTETQAGAALGHAGLAHDPAHKVDWRLAPDRPAVTGVEVTSDAGGDEAYTEGETVEAAVTFDAAVAVETEGGVPTLALIANGGIRRAAYVSGSGTARLVFAYRAVEADGSLGAAVRAAASGLKPNGGAIVAAAGGAAAALDFGEAPGVTAVSVGTQADGRWEAGDAVEVALAFAEPVAVEGAPTVALSFGGVERRAAYARGSGGERLTFAYTLAAGEVWQGTIGVAGDSLRLDGGSIVSAGGGLAAALAHAGVEGVAAIPPPSVTGVAVVSDAGSDATYGLGDIIRIRVGFSGAVGVTGSPGIGIDMDPSEWGEKRAVYESGSGTPTLVFVHEVVEPNVSTAGIAVLADSLILDGGAAIVSTATGEDALLGHAGLAHDPAHKVDWRLAPAPVPGAPAVTGVAVVSDAGADGTYLLGETIRVRLTFSKAVKVTGTPRIAIDMDPAEWGEMRAAFEGARDAAALALTFAHTVVEPNLSTQGIAVLADSLVLAGGTIRSAGGEDAALGHSGIAHDPAHKVDWRPAVSVADARAREGVDEAVVFEVSLSQAFTTATHSVTVDYATADGMAKAGEDYTATSGTLTFAAGETTKTVNVPILDDGHDEGHEAFTLRLSNVTGAREGDLEATGTIENADRIPRAWLARFGRTVAEQVVESVQARLDAPRGAGAEATFAGQALPSWAPGQTPGAGADNDDGTDGSAAAGFGGDDAERLARWLAGEDDEEKADETWGMTGREVLTSTAFSLTAAPEDGGASMAFWGRGGSSSFSGRDGPLSIDGEVTSATLGADWRSGSWLAGAMVKHSLGEGSYSGDGAGEVESRLTGIYPYGAMELGARVRAWAAAGLGEGTLTLTPKNPETGEAERAIETDMSLGMAALGAKGALVEPAGGSGFGLDLEADAFWVRTSSEAVRSEAGNLAAAEADVTRLRLGLDGGHAFALDGGGTLEPSFELGVRHDGGDAETGYGLDVGGGLRWHDPALGLTGELFGRGLVAHEASGLKDRGVSGSLAWDPDPGSDRGPTLALTQTLGAQAAGGADALLGRQTLADLAADDGMKSRRLELKLGYGVGAFGGRFTVTPELGFALSDTGRDYRLGWRLGLARSGPSSFGFGIEATRTEPANDAAPEHAIRLELEVRF